jgi:hypothetical protein
VVFGLTDTAARCHCCNAAPGSAFLKHEMLRSITLCANGDEFNLRELAASEEREHIVQK